MPRKRPTAPTTPFEVKYVDIRSARIFRLYARDDKDRTGDYIEIRVSERSDDGPVAVQIRTYPDSAIIQPEVSNSIRVSVKRRL